ncbi:hypothetical protein LSTR_LSTR000937 [Laodelphax striatellus]|uniref:C2H2-type domain-containing protein n=1 Tax=Laodelphax striatellus TaxID=195883 RepID=A0A482X1G7_LAOST|nr:hypothetical protein LSTR_LSTR000937 [Laodelphax striatellus]
MDVKYYTNNDVLVKACRAGIILILPKFTCDRCGKVYKYKYNLTAHQKLECGQEPQFACDYCPKRFYQKSHLKRHVLLLHLSRL